MTKTIIETERGFVRAEFVPGRRYPETFWFDETMAQPFAPTHASMLFRLLENNNIEVKRAFEVKL